MKDGIEAYVIHDYRREEYNSLEDLLSDSMAVINFMKHDFIVIHLEKSVFAINTRRIKHIAQSKDRIEVSLDGEMIIITPEGITVTPG
jgi:hypothetical protein